MSKSLTILVQQPSSDKDYELISISLCCNKYAEVDKSNGNGLSVSRFFKNQNHKY